MYFKGFKTLTPDATGVPSAKLADVMRDSDQGYVIHVADAFGRRATLRLTDEEANDFMKAFLKAKVG